MQKKKENMTTCEVVGCDKKAKGTAECCDVSLCGTHHNRYMLPYCSLKSCERKEEICLTCAKVNIFVCELCHFTLCDDCNTPEFWSKNKCNC